jgi:predicted phosphodiesterase
MRLLIISDIHGNKEALDAVMNVPHDDVTCLGDIVDYGLSPGECIDLVLNQKIPTIMGNHDNAVAFRMDCGCGYAVFDTDSFQAEIIRVEYDMEVVFDNIRQNMPNADELISILKRSY